MRILVTGAYGLIGSACLARLHRDGHDVVGLGRHIAAAKRQFAYAQWIEADFRRLLDVNAWRPLLDGIDAVVNCVGVLQDGAGDDTRRIHVEATSALFDACAQHGIRRVIQMSAIGADPAGPSEFSRTKAAADAHLQSLDLDWVILRPALVLAPAAYGGTALVRAIAALPLVTPLFGADARLQVVSVEDLADTVARAVKPGAPGKVMWHIANPQVLTLRALVAQVRGWLGLKPQRLIDVPPRIAAALVAAADWLGWLGWRSPMRSTSIAQLRAGVVGDPAPWMTATGATPAPLADILALRPASAQDRWFARLYFLKPVAIAGLAAGFVGSGVAALASLIFGPATAGSTVLAIVHVALGCAVAVRRIAPAALIGMAGITVIELVGSIFQLAWGTTLVLAPELLVILFTLAIINDR